MLRCEFICFYEYTPTFSSVIQTQSRRQGNVRLSVRVIGTGKKWGKYKVESGEKRTPGGGSQGPRLAFQQVTNDLGW